MRAKLNLPKFPAITTIIWITAWVLMTLFIVTQYFHGLQQLTRYSVILLTIPLALFISPAGKLPIGDFQQHHTIKQAWLRIIGLQLLGFCLFIAFILAITQLSMSSQFSTSILLQDSIYSATWYWGLFPWAIALITAIIASKSVYLERERPLFSKLLTPWFKHYKRAQLLKHTIDFYGNSCMLLLFMLTASISLLYLATTCFWHLFGIDITILDVKNLLILFGIATFLNSRRRRNRIAKLTRKNYGIGWLLSYYIISSTLIFGLLNIGFAILFAHFGIIQTTTTEMTTTTAHFISLQVGMIAWCWWFSYSIFMGYATAKVCRGYNIRQTILLTTSFPALLSIVFYYAIYSHSYFTTICNLLTESPTAGVICNLGSLAVIYWLLRDPEQNGRIRYGLLADDFRRHIPAKFLQQLIAACMSVIALFILMGISGVYLLASMLVLPMLLISILLSVRIMLQ